MFFPICVAFFLAALGSIQSGSEHPAMAGKLIIICIDSDNFMLRWSAQFFLAAENELYLGVPRPLAAFLLHTLWATV